MRRRIWGNGLASLLILLALTALVPAPMAGAGPAGASDADGDKVFDNLEARMDAKDRVDVIVLFNEGTSAAKSAAVRRDLGWFDVTYEYQTMPGLAASLTAGQVRALARRSDVAQVQLDAPVEFALDTARAAAGVDKARADFPDVDGNNERTGPCRGVRQYCKDDVVVAVVDSGIDVRHADLDGGKVIGGIDCSSGTCSGSFWNVDGSGHGTYVSSILAGEGDGNAAMRGVAPGAALVSVKVGSSMSTSAAVDAGLEWIIANKDKYGIELVNMSLAGRDPSDGTDSTSRLTNRLAALGVTAFAAAGNGAPDPGGVSFPAAAKYSVAVGSMSDPGDAVPSEAPGFALWWGSERGPTLDGRTKPDIVTHGVDITAAQTGSGAGYKVSGGTSAASPFAAGVAALLLDANPSLTSSGTACAAGDPSLDCADGVVDTTVTVPVKDLLTGTADDFGAPGKDNEYGAGRLDGYAAIDAASPAAGSGGPALPSHTHLSGALVDGGTASHAIDVTTTAFPLTAVLIMADRAAGASSPNFNVSIVDPAGAEVAASTSSMRQDTATFQPAATGTYTLRVTSVAGSGTYWLDVSNAAAPPPPPPPPTPTPTPTPDPTPTPTPEPSPTPTVEPSPTPTPTPTPTPEPSPTPTVEPSPTPTPDPSPTPTVEPTPTPTVEPTPTPSPTPLPLPVPLPPLNASAMSVPGSNSEIDVMWNDVAEEAGYRIERSSDGVSGWTVVGSTAPDVPAYRDTGLTPSTTYYYRIRAFNEAGVSEPSNVATARTNGDVTAPTAPTTLKASATRGKISLSWKASTDSGGSGLAGYRVFRSTSSTGTFTQIGTTSMTSFTDGTVVKGTTYWYYVVSYDKAANESSPSAKVSAKAT